jgi:inhibitor of KinA
VSFFYALLTINKKLLCLIAVASSSLLFFMYNRYPYTFSALGDGALLVDFGNRVDKAINQKVLKAFHVLKMETPSFIYDIVPAYSSLAVYYHSWAVPDVDKEETAFEKVAALVQDLMEKEGEKGEEKKRAVTIPVCYAPGFAPDLEELSLQKQLPVEDIIRIHTQAVYRVYMIGFLPGFAYMGEVDERIASPRKEKPRQQVAAGSVGIAGAQTGIYPMISPGGWQIIGRTPLSLFTKDSEHPALLQPGDDVTFYPISENEFNHY